MKYNYSSISLKPNVKKDLEYIRTKLGLRSYSSTMEHLCLQEVNRLNKKENKQNGK